MDHPAPARPTLPATLVQQQSDFTAEGAPPPVMPPDMPPTLPIGDPSLTPVLPPAIPPLTPPPMPPLNADAAGWQARHVVPRGLAHRPGHRR